MHHWCLILAVYEFEDRIPKIGKNTYVSSTVSVIGDVTIGEECYIAPGAVVRSKFEVPKENIVVGVPAKVIGEIQEHHREELTEFKRIYRSLAVRYPSGLKKIV